MYNIYSSPDASAKASCSLFFSETQNKEKNMSAPKNTGLWSEKKNTVAYAGPR